MANFTSSPFNLVYEPNINFIKMTTAVEQDRAVYLLDAQNKAVSLFEEIGRDLIRPGISEKTLSDEIHELGNRRHNVRTHWHKRVVRSGPNTLFPYAENPPDRVIEEDDILFVDLGPVFEQWEADFGRTFVLGEDATKRELQQSLEPIWKTAKARFDEDEDMTGEELYAITCNLAKEAGWEFGGAHAGHLVGDFPHERIPNDKINLYITEGNNAKMRSLNSNGNRRHWILEVHLISQELQIGAFMEQLLTVG